jgi:hypothetical protein
MILPEPQSLYHRVFGVLVLARSRKPHKKQPRKLTSASTLFLLEAAGEAAARAAVLPGLKPTEAFNALLRLRGGPNVYRADHLENGFLGQ